MLKEAGAYEEIADLILLLYREGYYDKEVADNTLDVIIGKQRQGIRNKHVLLDAEWSKVTIEDPN